MLAPIRAAQNATQSNGTLDPVILRRLNELIQQSNANVVPIGTIVPAKLSASDVSTYFDGTGLGNASQRWAGWAICNGSNGTPSLDGKFPRFETSASGSTGGSDTHAHDLSNAGGAKIIVNSSILRWDSGAGPSWTPAFKESSAMTAVGSGGASMNTAGLTGETDSGSTLPAYYGVVPVMRVA